MTLHDAFDRTISTWLDEEAGRGAPSYLDEVLVQTSRARQRPAWSSLERWLPVDTTLRLAPVPRLAWLFVTVALIVALAMVAALVGSRPRLPAPFGPAANGSLVYAAGGDIHLLDPATGASRILVGGPASDIAPNFSRDGTRFFFVRDDGTAERWSIFVAEADGSDPTQLTGPLGLHWATWSPDGTRLAVLDSSASTFLIVDADGGGTTPIDLGMKAESIQWRPNGHELVFRRVPAEGEQGPYGLYVVEADGTDLRAIASPTDNDLHWQNPALSPDGNRIAYTSWSGEGHLFVIDVTTGDIDLLNLAGADGSDYFASWSPDGTKIVFNRGRPQESYHVAIAPATGGEVVDIGPILPWAPAVAAEFSPDGTKVIARYDNGQVWMFDVSGGPGEQLPSSELFLASWQRLAP